jgi:hypothetical protein
MRLRTGLTRAETFNSRDRLYNGHKLDANRKVGELETRLLQLQGPKM